jgi:hypothetical protein
MYTYYIHGNEVIAVSTYAGKIVRGIAKCNPVDEFDVERGKVLAAARCNLKVAKKRRTRAAKKYQEAIEKQRQATDHMFDMEEYLINSNKAAINAERDLDNLLQTL